MELEELKSVFKAKLEGAKEVLVDTVNSLGGREAGEETARILDVALRAVDRAESAEVLFNIVFRIGQVTGVTVAKWLLASNRYHVAALLVRGLGEIYMGATHEEAFQDFMESMIKLLEVRRRGEGYERGRPRDKKVRESPQL